MMGRVMLWGWRVLMLAIVAFGVWGIWWQNVQLEDLNDAMLDLLDTVSVDAEPDE